MGISLSSKERRWPWIKEGERVQWYACMLKLSWAAASSNTLWATWFKSRYFKPSSIWHLQNTRSGSCIWKQIRLLPPFLQGACKWIVGNGNSISLWFDRWIDHDPIPHRFPDFSFSPLDTVSTIISVDGSWSIPNYIPNALQNFLQRAFSTHLPSAAESVPDKLIWTAKNGSVSKFSLSAAWNLVCSQAPTVP